MQRGCNVSAEAAAPDKIGHMRKIAARNHQVKAAVCRCLIARGNTDLAVEVAALEVDFDAAVKSFGHKRGKSVYAAVEIAAAHGQSANAGLIARAHGADAAVEIAARYGQRG